MSSKDKVSNKQKDINNLTGFLTKMLIMAITMLLLFMGTLVPALFFASFAASKRNKINGKILIEDEDSDYFIGKMEKVKETAKPQEQTLNSLFDNDPGPKTSFMEEVIYKPFKNLNMGLYPRIVNFNGYDKVFDKKNTKLIFFSFMMYYILPIVIVLYSLVGAVFYMLGKGIAFYNPWDEFVSKTVDGWKSGAGNTENNDLQKVGYGFLCVAVGIPLNIIRYILVKPVIGLFSGVFGGVLYLLKTLYNIYINPLLQGDIFETDKDKINKFDFQGQLQNKEKSFFKHIIKKLTLPFLALYCINVAIAASNDFSSSGLMIGTITITLLVSFFNYIKKK
jgi:hypothetical protein